MYLNLVQPGQVYPGTRQGQPPKAASPVLIYNSDGSMLAADLNVGSPLMEKDDKGLLEAMLHRLQIMRQESEQQTALLRQLCQAMDGLGAEIARLANTNEAAALAATAGRGRRPSQQAQPALASVSAQAALAKDLLARSQGGGVNGSGKSSGK